MLDLHGRGYAVEHAVECLAREAERARRDAYVTDALRLITENTARFAGGGYMAERWADGLRRPSREDADAVAERVVKGAGLVFADCKRRE